METYTGIWIDRKEAMISRFENGDENFITLTSDIKLGNTKGGSRGSTPWGPQDAVSESKVLAKKKQALHDFYNEIMQHLDDSEMIFITGPAETKKELHKTLENKSEFRNTPIYVQTLDKLTINQIRARIRNFFSSRT